MHVAPLRVLKEKQQQQQQQMETQKTFGACVFNELNDQLQRITRYVLKH